MTWSVVILLSFGCTGTRPRVEDTPGSTTQNNPTDANIVSTSQPEPLSTSTPIPIPDFADSIILYGGGGGGTFCQFELPPAPSVIGGTTFSEFYPRSAELCIAGVPEDEPVTIKLISPDNKISLNTEIRVSADNSDESALGVVWTGYPESKEYFLGADVNQANPGAPIEANLGLWWSGSLANGIWHVEVS